MLSFSINEKDRQGLFRETLMIPLIFFNNSSFQNNVFIVKYCALPRARAWRNASFRGYADYMQTPQFQKAVEKLISMAHRERIALMCAEAVPWRCHRSLIADALLICGIYCEDIINAGSSHVHSLTSFAKVDGTRITYP